MPTLSTHVSDEIDSKVREKAKKLYRGKVSAYLADLIESDILNSRKNRDTPMTPKERALLQSVAEKTTAYEQTQKDLERLQQQVEEIKRVFQSNRTDKTLHL